MLTSRVARRHKKQVKASSSAQSLYAAPVLLLCALHTRIRHTRCSRATSVAHSLLWHTHACTSSACSMRLYRFKPNWDPGSLGTVPPAPRGFARTVSGDSLTSPYARRRPIFASCELHEPVQPSSFSARSRIGTRIFAKPSGNTRHALLHITGGVVHLYPLVIRRFHCSAPPNHITAA